jgi:hypothetical protein
MAEQRTFNPLVQGSSPWGGTTLNRVNTPLRVAVVTDRSRPVKGGSKAVRRRTVVRWKHVRVQLQRDAHMRVPQPLRHDLGGLAGRDQPGSRRVAQSVYADGRQPCGDAMILEPNRPVSRIRSAGTLEGVAGASVVGDGVSSLPTEYSGVDGGRWWPPSRLAGAGTGRSIQSVSGPHRRVIDFGPWWFVCVTPRTRRSERRRCCWRRRSRRVRCGRSPRQRSGPGSCPAASTGASRRLMLAPLST